MSLPLHPVDALRIQNARIDTAQACLDLLHASGSKPQAIDAITAHARLLRDNQTQLHAAATALAAQTDED